MKSIIRFSIHFNKVFQKRGGRFLTVYHKGLPVNGKVLATNPIWATIQRADNQKLVRVLNFKVVCVNADHHSMTRHGNVQRPGSQYVLDL
jgi:hypothetical protein